MDGVGDDSQLDNETIRNTRFFKYLGWRITDRGGSDEEIVNKIGQARSA